MFTILEKSVRTEDIKILYVDIDREQDIVLLS